MITRVICALLLLLLAGLGIRATVAAVQPPTVAACWATDGVSVDTTHLSGGLAYYPIETEAGIEQGTGAFTVTHQVRFVDVGKRVYLPRVGR